MPSGCGSLNDYLRCFETPLAVLQSPEAVEYAAASLAERLREQGLLYAEIRFAPQLHQKNGHSQEAIVEAAIRGLRRSGLPGQLILCCMRGADEAANMDTLRASRAFLGQGVAALDLAGRRGCTPPGTISPCSPARGRRASPSPSTREKRRGRTASGPPWRPGRHASATGCERRRIPP